MKTNSPEVGNWLKHYFERRICRYFKSDRNFLDEDFLALKQSNYKM